MCVMVVSLSRRANKLGAWMLRKAALSSRSRKRTTGTYLTCSSGRREKRTSHRELGATGLSLGRLANREGCILRRLRRGPSRGGAALSAHPVIPLTNRRESSSPSFQEWCSVEVAFELVLVALGSTGRSGIPDGNRTFEAAVPRNEGTSAWNQRRVEKLGAGHRASSERIDNAQGNNSAVDCSTPIGSESDGFRDSHHGKAQTQQSLRRVFEES